MQVCRSFGTKAVQRWRRRSGCLYLPFFCSGGVDGDSDATVVLEVVWYLSGGVGPEAG